MLGFTRWFPLSRLAVGDLPRGGAIPAAYALRSASTGELLYIGSTGSLKQRIFGNFIGGVGGETTQRIHALLFEDGNLDDVELAWTETTTYRQHEAELKGEYCKIHGRLPKWTRL